MKDARFPDGWDPLSEGNIPNIGLLKLKAKNWLVLFKETSFHMQNSNMPRSQDSFHAVDAIPLPSNRKFGLLFAACFLLLGGVPWLLFGRFTGWPWIVGTGFLVAAFAAPCVLTPLNRIWMKFGLLLHHIISPVILGIMFFGLIVPIGVAMRLFGKRPIPVAFEPEFNSYWINRTPPGPEPESLRTQF